MRLAPYFLVLVLAVVAAAAPQAAGRSSSAESDVRLLAEKMEEYHPNLYHGISREAFAAGTDELARRASSLDRNELLVGLMRLAALPGAPDGHTGIFPLDGHAQPLHLFPLWL